MFLDVHRVLFYSPKEWPIRVGHRFRNDSKLISSSADRTDREGFMRQIASNMELIRGSDNSTQSAIRHWPLNVSKNSKLTR